MPALIRLADARARGERPFLTLHGLENSGKLDLGIRTRSDTTMRLQVTTRSVLFEMVAATTAVWLWDLLPAVVIFLGLFLLLQLTFACLIARVYAPLRESASAIEPADDFEVTADTADGHTVFSP